MGKKSKSQKFNATTDMANDPGPNSEIRMDDPQPHVSKPVVASKKKKTISNKNKYVRRSSRLTSVVRPAQNQEVGHVIEEIDLVENDREEEEPHIEDCAEQPFLESHEIEDDRCNNDSQNEPSPKQKTLDEKVDDLVRAFEEFKSKIQVQGTSGDVSDKGASTSFNYKNLYLGSQKKIEALTVENDKLARKLEIALAKLEAYDKMKEVMDKWQETTYISNLTKATEAVVNLTSQVVGGQFSSPGAAVDPGTSAMPKSSLANKRRRNETDN